MLIPRHRCSSCGRLVQGRCLVCQEARARRRDRDRPNASARGYTSDRWRQFRDVQLARYPLCAICAAHDRLTPATLVDHIIPVDGRHDPRFLRFDAVQSLCRHCHGVKTATEDSMFARRGAR